MHRTKTRCTILFCIFFSQLSCSKIGDYYALDKHGETESAFIDEIYGTDIWLSSNRIEEELNFNVILKRNESEKPFWTFKNLSISLNSIDEARSKLQIRLIDSAGAINERVLDPGKLNAFLVNGKPVTLVYKFPADSIGKKDRLRVKFTSTLCKGQVDTTINKVFLFYRFSRYRSPFAG